MGSKEGTIYVLRDGSAGDGGDGWVSPKPVDEVVTGVIVDATDLAADDLDDLSAYVDRSTLAAVVDGVEDEARFTVEGHDVVVTSDGGVAVDDA